MAVLVWFGLFQLPDVQAGVGGAPPIRGQEGAALVNQVLEEKVAQCVRQESDPKCMAVTRQRPGLCLGDKDCLDDMHLILAVKGLGKCSRVIDREQRIVCQAIRWGEAGACKELRGHKLVECQAVVRKDLTVCDKLATNPRSLCRGVWHLAQAVILNKAALCDEIPKVHLEAEAPNLMRVFCRAVVNMDPKRCKVDLRGYCRRRVSVDALSRYSCPLLEDAVLRQRCVIQFGR